MNFKEFLQEANSKKGFVPVRKHDRFPDWKRSVAKRSMCLYINPEWEWMPFEDGNKIISHKESDARALRPDSERRATKPMLPMQRRAM